MYVSFFGTKKKNKKRFFLPFIFTESESDSQFAYVRLFFCISIIITLGSSRRRPFCAGHTDNKNSPCPKELAVLSSLIRLVCCPYMSSIWLLIWCFSLRPEFSGVDLDTATLSLCLGSKKEK